MKRYLILAASLFVGLTTIGVKRLSAQSSNPTVFIEAEVELAHDFSAAVIRKKIPVTLTTDRRQAGYVARFTLAMKKGSTTRGVLTAVVFGAYMNGSYKRVSMSVIERKSQNMIYSDTCETGARHMRSFADCLAKHWKKSLGGGKTKMRKFTPADLEGIRDEQAEKVSVRNANDTVLAKITSHPVPAALILQGATVPEAPTEYVADASRRGNSEKAAPIPQP
jgi:hypothetical protein